MAEVQKCRLSDISKKEKTSDEEDEETEENCPVDVSPQEMVFSIDHIMKQIFGSLASSDLFTCRLVSHRFLNFTKILLHKRIHLLVEYGLQIRDYSMYAHTHSRLEKSLQQLTKFLELSSSPFPESNPKLISFPCTRFSFVVHRLGDDILQSFLNVHGPNILRLTVFVRNIHENVIMDQVVRLLTIQAPHLEHLTLSVVNVTVEWEQPQGFPTQSNDDENPPNRHSFSPLLKTDPEFQQISSRLESIPRKSSLKVLNMVGDGFAKVLELILQISPKLQDVTLFKMPKVLGYNIYLSQPVNRVYLLRRCIFKPVLQQEEYHNCGIDTMEKLLEGNNLQLGDLCINFTRALPACKTNREFEKRVVSVTNRLLEQCRDTLETLTLCSFKFLPGLKMPSTMENVRKIEIKDFYATCDASATVFPKGFSLSEAFPKLACVQLSYERKLDLTVDEDPREVTLNDFYEFIKRLEFQKGDSDSALSLHVSLVILSASCFLPEGDVIAPAFVSERVQKLFPSARVKFTPFQSFP